MSDRFDVGGSKHLGRGSDLISGDYRLIITATLPAGQIGFRK
jgi:hypothetical protein